MYYRQWYGKLLTLVLQYILNEGKLISMLLFVPDNESCLEKRHVNSRRRKLLLSFVNSVLQIELPYFIFVELQLKSE